MILNFSFCFFKYILQNHSVREAVSKSNESVKGSMMFIIQHFGSQMDNTSIFDSYGSVLINAEDPNHGKQIFALDDQ